MVHEDEYTTYAEVKERLDEIVDAVNDDDLSIEDALALYEEAVGLGLAASDLIERDIDERRLAEEADAEVEVEVELEAEAEAGAGAGAGTTPDSHGVPADASITDPSADAGSAPAVASGADGSA